MTYLSEVSHLDHIQGAPIAPSEALPVPPVAPEAVVTVTDPVDDHEHRVEIFSSNDHELGTTVTTLAQRLHTEVYLDKKLISPKDLNRLGVFVDEYSKRSTYMYVKNGIKVAAARYIQADKKQGGLLSLPTTKHFEIDSEKLCEAAGVRSLADVNPNKVVEISGLVARKQEGESETQLDATMALYARMLRESLEKGHSLWLLNVEKGFLRYLNFMVGRDQVKVLGPEKDYMGPPTLPVAINPQTVIRHLLTDDSPGSDMKRGYLKEVFAGVDDKRIPKDIRTLLKQQEISTSEYSPTKRFLLSPKNIAYAGIMGYSTARAVPASGVEQFDGSTPLLWGIDVATAIPYTWGVIEAATGKTLSKRAIGAAVGVSSFIAPYAYFGMSGENYPGYVKAAVGGFVGVVAIKETLKHVFRSKKEVTIREGLRTTDLIKREVAMESALDTPVAPRGVQTAQA